MGDADDSLSSQQNSNKRDMPLHTTDDLRTKRGWTVNPNQACKPSPLPQGSSGEFYEKCQNNFSNLHNLEMEMKS